MCHLIKVKLPPRTQVPGHWKTPLNGAGCAENQWSNSKSGCLVHIIFTCLHSASSTGFLLGQFCATHSNVGACWLVFNESRHLVDGSVWTKRHCLLKARKNPHLSLCSSHRFTLSCGSWTDLLQKFASVMIPI